MYSALNSTQPAMEFGILYQSRYETSTVISMSLLYEKMTNNGTVEVWKELHDNNQIIRTVSPCDMY